MSLLSLVCSSLATSNVTRVRAESCIGCRLHRLPEVRDFLLLDVERYSGAEFVRMPGALPTLTFFDREDHAVRRVDLTKDGLTREDINQVMVDMGFKMKKGRMPPANEKVTSYFEDVRQMEMEQEERRRREL